MICNGNQSNLGQNVATPSREGGRPALAIPLSRWRRGRRISSHSNASSFIKHSQIRYYYRLDVTTANGFRYNSSPNSPFTRSTSSVPVDIHPERDFSRPMSDSFQAKTQPQPQSEPAISSSTFQSATVLIPRPVTFVDPQTRSNKSPTSDRQSGPKSPGGDSNVPHKHRATYKGQF